MAVQDRRARTESAPVAAATGYVLLYVALALVFTDVTAAGVAIGALASAGVVLALSHFTGANSRITVLGGFVFTVAVAVVATYLS